MQMDDDLVTLARFDWLAHANLARCRLAAGGIEAFLFDEYTISLCWHWGSALGGVRLQVSRQDVEDARAILEEAEQPSGEPILTDHEQVTERALRAAVFGTVQSIFYLWACWLLLPVLGWRDPLGVTERRNIVAAMILIGLMFVFPALVFLALKHMR
jgi:Putative prokaryotic signal transducing protein